MSQQITVEELIGYLDRGNLFLTGGAGTGKSWLTGRVIEAYREAGRGVVPLGSTGVSAVNIGGMTLHSFFVFGICNDLEELREQDRRNKGRLKELAKLLQSTELIVIDEISMVSARMMDMIRFRLESLGYRGRLMLVGDFYQLPPVVRGGEAGGDLFSDALYAFESDAWTLLAPRTVELTRIRRTEDRTFADILSRIRRGELDDESRRYLMELCNREERAVEDATWLFGRNDAVERMNRESLNRIESDEEVLFGHLKLHGRVPERRLESWLSLLPVSRQLNLKVGAPVLFTVNRWGRYVNGERGVLRGIEEDHLIVEKKEGFVRVERHDFDLPELRIAEDGSLEHASLATLSQFPVKLAYAVTIHKSQGMSIDRLVCNVDGLFAPSQFYVAISRATDPRRLKIDFSQGDFVRYLQRVVSVDDRVKKFYGELS